MAFQLVHNRREAAAQDYELAKAEYRAICQGFDATDERSIQRFHAALARKNEAWERWMFYRFNA